MPDTTTAPPATSTATQRRLSALQIKTLRRVVAMRDAYICSDKSPSAVALLGLGYVTGEALPYARVQLQVTAAGRQFLAALDARGH